MLIDELRELIKVVPPEYAKISIKIFLQNVGVDENLTDKFFELLKNGESVDELICRLYVVNTVSTILVPNLDSLILFSVVMKSSG